MTKNEIGSLINKGMTVEEIRQRIKDFPQDPDIQYFIDLGYKKNTAMIYRSKLKKNNLKEQNKPTVKNSKNDEGKTTGSFWISKRADKDNIILDTCALGYKETIDIIEESSKVTVIYATLKELDSVEKDEDKEEYLKKNIRNYTKIMLHDDEKYRLVPFKRQDKRYPDEMILEYLMQLPINERPTLLTVDQNLALRAKCLGIEYILYLLHIKKKADKTSVKKQKEIDSQEDKKNNIKPTKAQSKKKLEEDSKELKVQNKEKCGEKQEKGNLGVSIKYINDKVEIKKYNPQAVIMCVYNGECFEILEEKAIESFDYFAVIAKSKKGKSVRVQKVMMVNNERVIKEFQCFYVNDIYQLDNELHMTILDNMKSLL